jgi:hypothetical protein
MGTNVGTNPSVESSLSRRRFLQRSAVFGVGMFSLDALLAACGTSAATGGVTATVNSLPPSSNPGALYVFNQLVNR